MSKYSSGIRAFTFQVRLQNRKQAAGVVGVDVQLFKNRFCVTRSLSPVNVCNRYLMRICGFSLRFCVTANSKNSVSSKLCLVMTDAGAAGSILTRRLPQTRCARLGLTHCVRNRRLCRRNGRKQHV